MNHISAVDVTEWRQFISFKRQMKADFSHKLHVKQLLEMQIFYINYIEHMYIESVVKQDGDIIDPHSNNSALDMALQAGN
jgi:hypothetical protein